MTVRLTELSHGAGCGCKIAPDILERILHTGVPERRDARLLVGNESRDDAAVADIGNGTGIISTTDFFMPVVDDPYDFGRIAAANAISDVYAMGGRPIMAIAILGWPVATLAPEIAGRVIDGGRAVCAEAGITLAGGHSIDSPEPIFGLAVTGQVATNRIIRNNTAKAGDLLYLTKPLGVGILTSALKKRRIRPDDLALAVDTMAALNKAGEVFAELAGVHAMTDVTGFGLAGHLLEICRGSHLSARINRNSVPVLPNVQGYIEAGCVPGGTHRNAAAFAGEIAGMGDADTLIFCDPQTSGGLLVAVDPAESEAFEDLAKELGLRLAPIGQLHPSDSFEQSILISD
ncbi:selenide, water dikinase [Streptosporangium jomthongense]|uniref:Selenide, water dikinase n=1 Tax=Marinobacter aromaticivorans TaxID=1494078 RepID=A0ABW2IR64_9GAMM|nr:selenide, water dikinase SelD [Marinobacter aromaticivorans]GGE54607.1 selenide, water dikinase [Streptosporangium jomthongense]